MVDMKSGLMVSARVPIQRRPSRHWASRAVGGVLAVLGITGLMAGACFDNSTSLPGKCIDGWDCSYMPDTSCSLGFCVCPVYEEGFCNGGCHTWAECEASVGAGGGRDGAVTGTGVGGDMPPAGECVVNSDCGTLDPRCGSVACVNGVCERLILSGPTASQLKGDCERTECDADGHVITVKAPEDSYNDGLQCTQDACGASGSSNTPEAKGSACPETDGVCDGAGVCVACVTDSQCTMVSAPKCIQGRCSPASCNNQTMDDTETGKDCGGLCSPCGSGKGCLKGEDCASGFCVNQMCAVPTCVDGVQNGNETDTDCGTPNCGSCADGSGCKLPEHCKSGVCWAGKCQESTCFDGVRNNGEIGPDCGEPCKVSCQ